MEIIQRDLIIIVNVTNIFQIEGVAYNARNGNLFYKWLVYVAINKVKDYSEKKKVKDNFLKKKTTKSKTIKI